MNFIACKMSDSVLVSLSVLVWSTTRDNGECAPSSALDLSAAPLGPLRLDHGGLDVFASLAIVTRGGALPARGWR